MIAVLGASGQLGTAFIRLLGDEAIPATRAELDLSRLDDIGPWLVSTRPDVVINCAAYTAVDAAEDDQATARLINATAVGRLAEVAAETHIALVTFSTDYVFDGSKPRAYVESDMPHPLNVYGSTKLEGEKLVADAYPAALVIRTSWVLSGTHRNFAATMLELLSKGTVRVVDDQVGKPTMVDDLAQGTMAAIDAGATGLLHMANKGETTWCGLAREVAEIAGLDPHMVQSITTDEFPRPAKRPSNSVLESERLDEFGLQPLPHHRPSLERAVKQLLAATS
jgi:dTDP-4-dehydrorhamnose reductase